MALLLSIRSRSAPHPTTEAGFTISKWLKATEERKRTLADHNAAVLAALRRIELALGDTSKSKLP